MSTAQPRVHRASFIGLGSAIITMSLALVFPEEFESILTALVNSTIEKTEWVYLTGFTVIVLTVFAIAISPIGKIKIGGEHATSQFSTLSWLALIFTSTQGGAIIGLSIYQPLAHLETPPFGPDSGDGTIAEALGVTLYTWGFHAWAIWTLLAIVAGYYSYNRMGPNGLVGAVWAGLGPRAPTALRKSACVSTEVATLLASWFGLCTSLAIICRQLSGGIVHVLGIEGEAHQFGPTIAIIGTVVFCAVALTGIGNGVRKVSNTNLVTALCFVVAILLLGNTTDTLTGIFDGLGHYLGTLFTFSFELLQSDNEHAVSYRRDWAMSFLMWWLVYSSMFAMLFARISYGRTIRAMVIATCIIPTLVCLLWFGIMSISGTQLGGSELFMMGPLSPAKTIYDFLGFLPLSDILVWVVLVVSALFLVTTGAPAIHVLIELLTGSSEPPSKRYIIYVAICIGVVLSVSAGVSKFQALQSIAIAVSFPFSIIYLMVILLGIRGFSRQHREISPEEAKLLAPVINH